MGSTSFRLSLIRSEFFVAFLSLCVLTLFSFVGRGEMTSEEGSVHAYEQRRKDAIDYLRTKEGRRIGEKQSEREAEEGEDSRMKSSNRII